MINHKKCKLCGIELSSKNRRKSHALTKSSFFDQTSIKPGDHLLAVSIGKTGVYDAGHHTWEYILCKDCELKLGKWEEERERFLSSAKRPTATFEKQNFIETAGFNQEHIVLACLTDLYRCSVFEDSMYERVNLGSKHSARIATILNRGKIDNFNEYPVVFWRFNNQEKILDEAFFIPYKARTNDGLIFYKTIAPRGWLWMMKVDSRPCEAIERVALGSNQNIRTINAGNIYSPNNKDILQALTMAIYRINNR